MGETIEGQEHNGGEGMRTPASGLGVAALRGEADPSKAIQTNLPDLGGRSINYVVDPENAHELTDAAHALKAVVDNSAPSIGGHNS